MTLAGVCLRYSWPGQNRRDKASALHVQLDDLAPLVIPLRQGRAIRLPAAAGIAAAATAGVHAEPGGPAALRRAARQLVDDALAPGHGKVLARRVDQRAQHD